MNKIVSIIIPVYNVEKYLIQCLESVINQTYKNLQIILINDGSTDKSYEICLKYSQKDNRIVLINQENKGSASAKNKGLRIAYGDYIGFLDSDDFIELNSIEYMVNVMEYNDVDIVQCELSNTYINLSEITENSSLREVTMSSEEFLRKFLIDWKSSLFCNKLFKKEILKGIYFKEGRCIDDEFFTYKCVMRAKLISISNKKVYNYRIRKSSIMRSEECQRQILKDRIDYLSERYNIISKNYKDLDSLYLENMLIYFLIISKDYYIDEDLINYIKYKLKHIKINKILTTYMEKGVKFNIIKLMVTKSKKYIKYKNNKEILKNNYNNCFD